MKTITSVNEAIDLIKDSSNFQSIWPKNDNRYPFGLWFRGQVNSSWPLVPSIFRKDENIFLDETGMFTHFQLRLSSYNKSCDSTFDWICLMQHYGLPTRILDWTESILVALYFAVLDNKNHNKNDGKLFVLNGKTLNSKVLGKYALVFPKIFHCSLRSVMAPVNKFYDLLNMPELQQNHVYKKQLSNLKEKLNKEDIEIISNVSSPIAVFPNRNNERMILQNSVFTLHGGKIYKDSQTKYKRIPTPKNLETIGDKILIEYVIPAKAKGKIRKELSLLNFHQASLFPELENQSEYIRQYWSIPKK